MKISLSDRYEALRRHPGYCKDWEAWQQASGKTNDDEFKSITGNLKSKYHVPRLPTPLRYSSYNRLQVKPKPIEVISLVDPKEKGPEFWGIDTTSEPPLSRGHKLTVDDFLEEERYLHLEVDLGEPLPTLERAFKETVQKWMKIRTPAKQRKERRGRTTVDPWQVYDQCEYQGKNLLQIAKERSGINKNPAYNNKVQAEYKQVKRAYDKAEKMIRDSDLPVDD